MTDPFDDIIPSDPVALGGMTGAVFVPIVGLEIGPPAIQLGDMQIVRLPVGAWRMMEPNRYVDFFRDAYQAAPKTFLLVPFSADELKAAADTNAALERLMQHAQSRAERLVLALRLFKQALLIDPFRVVIYARFEGNNYRWPDDRYRFYTAVIGDPVTLPAKTRRLGDREVFFPQRTLVSLGGPPIALQQQDLGHVERLLALLDGYVAGTGDVGLDHVAQGFRRAWDVMLALRLRRVALLGAFETMFGRFGRRNDPAGIGAQVASLWRGFGLPGDDVQGNVDGAVRDMRNAYAHGAERKRSLDEDLAQATALESLRLGLRALFALATLGPDDRSRLLSSTNVQSTNWPMNDLRGLLRSATQGDGAAAAAVSALAATAA